MIKNSLVIPVYKNEENIPYLLVALEKILKEKLKNTEVVFVVDGSPDNSYRELKKCLPRQKFKSQLICHSRNFGSFPAIRTGLVASRGEFVAVMAADLQEPPELILEFFKVLASGEAEVVFGERERRSDGIISGICSHFFWGIFRKFIMKDVPKGGVDIFGCNRAVKDSLLTIEEPNSSLLAQLFWVGYKRKFITYERRKREHGKSAWSFRGKVKYMLDSIFSFSDLPIQIVIWLGVLGMSLSALWGIVIFVAKLRGAIDASGYSTIMLSILFFSSLILFTQGIIGLYLWRTFENSKRRPLSIVASMEKFNE